ncbi:MAG: CvpA family protein [Synergistales bacterium]|nr:CvpA family protein [Synergistales bacterium]
MNSIVDIVAALVAAFLLFRGFWRGGSGEILSMLGTVGGVLLAWLYGPDLRPLIVDLTGIDAGVAQILAMVVIFVAVTLFASLLQLWVKAFLRITRLSLLDRILGIGAGAAKVVALLLLVYVGGILLSPVVPNTWMRGSKAMELAAAIWPVLQKNLQERGVEIPDSADLSTPGAVQSPLQ